ncbi:MAG TPA: hypothetical protein DF383_12875 [Deltaproteobacteria bacterium]|nr:hypothetical protein [Deltaproteobacteria bacterium]
MKSALKKCIALFLILGSGLLAPACTSNKEKDNLQFPAIVAIDNVLRRVFVIDNQFNGLNLIDPDTNQVILFGEGKNAESLLNDEDPQILPQFPSNGVVTAMPGEVSRLFVIGGGGAPQNQIVVLDFDFVNLIRTANISPIEVSGSATDTLVGLATDVLGGVVFVSNASTGAVHAYDVTSGVELADSPVMVGGVPGRMNFDPDSGLLVVSNATAETVDILDANDLAAGSRTVNVGIFTRDAALATNASGSILFVSASQQNIARAFRLDLNDLANSTQIFELLPNAPTQPVPIPNFVPGSINFAKAGNLSDGRMGGFYTMSTGDLLEVDLFSDLSAAAPAITSVGAISGEGLDTLLNGSGAATKVYYASPGLGVVTVVDPLTNGFIDQIP